ncbi:MAG: J domain-containing protein [Sandaracinaceae bacterium]
MDSLPGGAALARGLLVLARAGRSGVLTVQSREVTARVGVNKGRVVAMKVEPEDGDSLGDALRRMGDWDEEAAASHGQPAPGEAVSGWAVRVGATSDAALSLALRKQLQRRIARLFAVDPPELRLRPGSLDVGVPQLVEPPTTAELIVGALRDRVASQPLLSARRRLGDGILVLTPLGKELLADAVLWPDEQAMLPLLESGASVDVLVAASQGSARAQRTLYALRMIDACGSPEPREGYAMLLRKTRQLKRAARAAELLELAPGAQQGDARKALRKLARAVHPDRFGTNAPAAIRSASQQVMSALNRASHDLS